MVFACLLVCVPLKSLAIKNPKVLDTDSNENGEKKGRKSLITNTCKHITEWDASKSLCLVQTTRKIHNINRSTQTQITAASQPVVGHYSRSLSHSIYVHKNTCFVTFRAFFFSLPIWRESFELLCNISTALQ